MKKILLLLLLTVSVYGQNPSRFAKIQITGNTNSGTATKVNVQEANGEVNTQTINTGFNKNIGLGGSDVVGANTLLNQYSTTPVYWTATSFSSGQVVFYGGKQWISNVATVAGDVPSVSSKWGEITFEALANKTVTVDQTIIDGSTNAVAGNAVFDGLATKAPISSVHNPVTLGTANGLSLSNQQLSLGLASSGTTGALSGTDWNTFNNKQDALGFTPENVANKATDFSVVDNVKYPTVQAVSNKLLESNKKWVLFGDSISNTLLDPDYPFYVIDNLKLTGTVTNAVAGNVSGQQLTILQGLLSGNPNYFNDFDIATLLVGVNDWATGVPLGKRTSLSSENNYAGHIKKIIELILTAKPSIRLYVMTPFETNSVEFPYQSFNSLNYTIKEMSVLVAQICSDYGVQCIDLYSLSQLNAQTITALTSDGVHPNSEGASLIGDLVARAFLAKNNEGKQTDYNIRKKRENLYEEVNNNIYKIQDGNSVPSSVYEVNYNVGIGLSSPKLKFQTVSANVNPEPVLGSDSVGSVSFLSNNSFFGEYIGISNTGDVWHQVQRNDGNTTAYNLLFNPLGGNVIIGSIANTGEKLQVTGDAKITGTVTASPATTANQVPTWGQVQAIASSGVYAASISNASNIGGITIGRANYMKIGNVVSVNFSGSATFITTSASATFEISLPFNKTLTNNGFTVGSAIPVSVGIISTGIIQHINSVSTVRVIINSSAMNGLGAISGSFMYNVQD